MTELAEIVDTLEFLGDWDARYQYLMDLGEQLPPMPESLKTDANHVKPCMSTVHVAALPSPDAGCIRYLGDCDTAIIKGVLAVLISLCSEHSNEQIQALDSYQRKGGAALAAFSDEAEKRVAAAEQEIASIRESIAKEVDNQKKTMDTCNRRKLEVQRVLEFFGPEMVGRVVKDSPKLIDPTAPDATVGRRKD